MENQNEIKLNSFSKDRIEFIKQKAEEAKAKLLQLAEKHNIYTKS